MSAPVRGRPRANGKEPERIVALDTALEILRAIYNHEGWLSLTDLSRMTGEPPNKLQRYLASLKHAGILLQSEESGLYDLGPEAFNLGVAALRRYDPMIGVQSAVRQIAKTTGFTTNIYVWTAAGPTLIMQQPGVHQFPMALKLGTALPLCHSASGLVFLAMMPPERTKELLASEIELAERDQMPISLEAIEAKLNAIRETDIYWSWDTVLTGKAAVLPLFDASGNMVCTITSIVPRGYYDADNQRLLEGVLREARDRLGRPSGHL